jgi:Sulfatase
MGGSLSARLATHVPRVGRGLSRLLLPWPGLISGLLALRVPEFWQAVATGGHWLTAGAQMLANDALAALHGWMWWCVLAWPCLTIRLVRGQLLALGALGSLVLLAQAALVHYFQVAGVPLGADLLAYSLDELRTTVQASQTPWPMDVLSALGLGLLCLWGVVWDIGWSRAQQLTDGSLPDHGDGHVPETVALRPSLALGLLGLSLLSAAALPLQWTPDQATAATAQAALNQNKLAVFAGDVLAQTWQQATDPKTGALMAGGDPAYPFARPESTPDTLGPHLALKDGEPPHLIVLVVEGLGRSFSGPQARLGSFTPFLDELAARSLYWDNFLATQGRTFAVLPSLFGSLPFGPHGSRPLVHDSLLSVLKAQGYDLRYFMGSNLAFDQQGAYMASEGVDTQMSERDFDRPERRLSEWGYADGDLLEAMVQRLRQVKNQPSVTVVQTMSMHSPFVVPEQAHYRRLVDARLDTLGLGAEQRAEVQRQRDVYASVMYTDAMLRRFFQDLAQLPSWRNTVVVITGDHRLPEIPMVHKLERYHVPLLVASPLLRGQLQVKAVSSHFDLAPSILAMLSQRYGWATPASVAWMGTGLDTATEFRNLHALPLQQTKTELSDYISGLNYWGQGRLYRIGDGLQPEPMDNPALQARLGQELAQLKAAMASLNTAQRLTPPASAGQRRPYVANQRTLEPKGHASDVEGVVVSGLQPHWPAPEQLQVQGVFHHNGPGASATFVPLLVVSDAQGQEWGEAYGVATQLAEGQSTEVRLQLVLRPEILARGPLFASLVVSHPDNGKPIGQGQYHVPVRP